VDKLKQKQKLDVLLWTTLVERAGAEINDNFDTLVVLGKPTEKRMEIIRKLAKQARRVIISGGFSAPFALGNDAAGKNILDKTQAFGGEFCSGEFLEAWRETGKFDESAGRGDFVEGWLKKVFPDAAGSAADGVNGGTGTTGGKKSFGVFYSLFPTAQANEKAQTNAKTVIFKTLKLPTPRGMTRAELVYLSPAVPPAQCAGTLLLCPGWNGDGTFFLHDSAWRSLAEKHNLSLVALRFSSYDEGESVSPAAEKNGYHHAANGAGALLFEGLRKINGSDLPLAVFGFSRGGQFAQSLAVNFPERVLAWASTGSATGDEFPNAKSGKVLNSPPGLVMCGFDDTNCSTAQSVFLAGLRAGWKMCWLGIKNSGHQIDPRGTVFAQKFFDGVLISVLKNSPPENNRSGIWVDAAERNGLDGFLIKVWFPNKVVQKAWEDFGAR
jgi:pimeloyl-ACP methyl ester carboxylesterase